MSNWKDLTPEQRDIILAYDNVCRDASGRKVLLDILEYCGLFVTGAKDSNSLWLREGQKSVAVHIISRMQDADYKHYPEMMLQYAEEEKTKELKKQEECHGK